MAAMDAMMQQMIKALGIDPLKVFGQIEEMAKAAKAVKERLDTIDARLERIENLLVNKVASNNPPDFSALLQKEAN